MRTLTISYCAVCLLGREKIFQLELCHFIFTASMDGRKVLGAAFMMDEMLLVCILFGAGYSFLWMASLYLDDLQNSTALSGQTFI